MSRVPKKPRLRLHKPPAIKHVMQLGPPEPDCGVACCGMIAQADYTEAWLCANTYGEDWDIRGMSANEVIRTLAGMTGKRYRFHRLPYPRVHLTNFTAWPDVPSIAIIRADRDKKGHMIAWNPRGKRVHDPLWHCGIPLATYKRWIDPTVRVIGFILPCPEPEGDGAA